MTGAWFPRLAARDLDGRQAALPPCLPGEWTVVIIAFRREQQELADSWVPWLKQRAAPDPRLGFVELPAVGMHRPVTGHSGRGLPYDASDPALAAWVHYSLTDSFLTAYRVYGARPCPPADADRYVREQTRLGELLGAEPLPDTAAALSAWVASHPGLAPSPASAQAITFLRRPPLPPAIRAAYHLLLRAAVATLPSRIQEITGLPSRPGDLTAGRAAVTALRWALGSSPDWQLALARTSSTLPAAGAPPPAAAHDHITG